MPVSADRVIVELEARIGKYRRDMEAAEKAGTKSFGKIGSDAKKAERQILQSSTAISGSLRGLAGSFAAAFSAREIGGLIDGYTRFTNQLKVAGLEGQELVKVQKELIAVGNQYGVSIEELSRLYGGLSSLQKDLNTTSADTLNLTQAVAASIKISGVSSARAAGAILGLNQAFAQIRVQSDEYNQILDGARPLLQAAVDASDKYRGSLARLKQDIEKGNVSGADLFRTIQGGTAVLFPQAELSTLTLAGAFTSLRDALTVYVGEASASNGTTAALSAGIEALADNLDTLATALGVISAVLIGRYAAGLVAAAGSNGVLAASIFAVQTRAIGAATSLEAMAFAGRAAGASLLAAFGGPVGLAIAAITVALGFAVAESLKLSEAQQAQADGVNEATNASKSARDALQKLATATGAARAESIELVKQKRKEIAASIDVAKAAIQEARAKAAAASAKFQIDAATANNAARFSTRDTGALTAVNSAGQSRAADAELTRAVAKFDELQKTLVEIDAALSAPPRSFVGTPTEKNKEKGPKGKTAEQITDEALRNTQNFENELRQLRAEQLQNELAITTSAERRLDIQGELAEIERIGRIAAINADRDLTDARRKRLIAETNKAFGLEPDGVTVNTAFNALGTARSREFQEAELELARRSLRDKIDTLQTEADLSTNRVERLSIQRRILELEQQEERDALEAAIRRGEIADAEDAQLRLAQRQANARRLIEREGESPLQRYRREIGEVGNNINDELERVQVDGLNSLNEGLVDAIAGAKSLGDVFADVANSIIKDLLRIAIQRAVIGPLAGDGNNGGGLLGGVIGAIGGFFGGGSTALGKSTSSIANSFGGRRASGGNVTAGKIYQINENGPEFFQPSQSGKIYPTGSLKARGSGGGTIVIAPQQFDLTGVVMTEDLIRRLDARNRAYADEVSKRMADQTLRATPGYNEQTRQLRG